MIIKDFKHRHAGHCETGATAALLSHYGLALSEPMALGLSASLTFAHIPFVKVGGFPLTTYRMPPGSVYQGLRRPLGLQMERRRFRDPATAEAALDAELAAGRPVGLQTSVYWLPYFPPEMRFHFNAHNIVVYGKDGGDYLVSDPVFDQPQRCAAADLRRARFAKGVFAPRGLMYRPLALARDFDLGAAVRRAVGKTWKMMLHAPVSIVGVRAIERLAERIGRLDRQIADARLQRLYVGNIVRMQEEIGTGGGGFRFMYAAFLQEAGEKLRQPALVDASQRMTAVGDTWRQFALLGAQFSRRREGVGLPELAARLHDCAAGEREVYEGLKRWSKGSPAP
ncbi:MAG: BtrH N-terminal domain-containing protein [Pseudomonadota bacterium]